MIRLRKTRSARDLLNITPLIDVVFILLVFFMLATNFAQYRLIGVDAPERGAVVLDADGAVVILLLASGEVTVDGDPAAPDGIEAAVAAVRALDPNRAFIVRPERGVSLQSAIAAYDAARRAGARQVSFSRPAEVAP